MPNLSNQEIDKNQDICKKMPYKELKWCKRAHDVATVLIILYPIFGILSFLVALYLWFSDKKESSPILFVSILVIVGLIYLLATFGIIYRTKWGLILLIVTCVPLLISVNIPTLLAIAALVCSINGRKIYTEKLSKNEVVAEIRRRKSNAAVRT